MASAKATSRESDVMRCSVPDEVIKNIEAAARGSGKHESVLAAFGDDIERPSDCPVEFMPLWLAELIEALGAGIAAKTVSGFMLALAGVAKQWDLLDDAAWGRIFSHFNYGCLELSLELAASKQSDASQAYWKQAGDVAAQVLAALRGEGDVAAARETADGEMWRWQSEAFGSDPVRDALPMDAGWALKCLAETTCCVTDMRQDGVAGAAETAAATAAFNVNNRAAAYGLLAKRLFSLLHTEIAAAKNWVPPLSF
jgi:hypothetical protein